MAVAVGISGDVGLCWSKVNGAPWSKKIFAFVAIKRDITRFPYSRVGETEHIGMKGHHPLEKGREFVKG